MSEKNQKRINKIKNLMLEERLSNKELAERIGVSSVWVCYMLNGKKPVSDKTIRRIMEAFPSRKYEWMLGEAEYRIAMDNETAKIIAQQAADYIYEKIMEAIGS